jgi:tRNA pseudouridine55 synthase
VGKNTKNNLLHVFSILDVMTDGILLIDKPTGMSSFGVVARIRRVLSEQQGKKVKVGHTGTLDPFATGLMILVIGKECKNAGKYSKLDKIYEATFRLGQTSSTGDPEGEITEVNDTQPTREEIERMVSKFTGDIMQRPPIFSALKINGQRAYKLAREGKDVEIPERQVTIHSLEVVEYAYPNLKIRTHVSSGTYIRSLASDIGEVLGTGAYCTQLRRTAINKWDVADAKTLADFGIDS